MPKPHSRDFLLRLRAVASAARYNIHENSVPTVAALVQDRLGPDFASFDDGMLAATLQGLAATDARKHFAPGLFGAMEPANHE